MRNPKISIGLGVIFIPFLLFAQIPYSTTPSWVSQDTAYNTAVDVADVDGDGDLDIAVGRYGYPNGARNALYYNNNGLIETSPSWLSADSTGTKCIAWGDYDGDGDPDLACGNVVVRGEDGFNTIYENVNGTLTTTPVWISNDSEDTFNILWADLDNDGDLDLIAGNYNGEIGIYYNNNGVINTTPQPPFPGTDAFTKINFGDINNDGDLDMFLNFAMHMRVYQNLSGIFSSTPYYVESDSDAVYDIALADVDLDGDLDVGVARYDMKTDTSDWKGYNGLFLNYGTNLSTSPNWHSSDGRLTTAVGWGDLDNDNYPEMVSVNHPAWDGEDWILGNDAIYDNIAGTLVSQPAWASEANDKSLSMALADLDNGDLITTTHNVVGNGYRSLFYLPHPPLHKLNFVKVGLDTLETDEFCYDRKNGWVSLADPVPNGTTVSFNYIYSRSLDLLVANNGQNKIYLNTNTALKYPPPLATYPEEKLNPPKIIIKPRDTSSMVESMMATDNAIAMYESYGDHNQFNFDNIHFWRIECQWPREEYPGFYLFEQIDYAVENAYQRDVELCMSVFYVPHWADANGDWGPEDLSANSAFFQVLIDRYGPGGILGGELGWNPDYGIKIWSMENEPVSVNFWGIYWFGHLNELVTQMQYSYSLVKTLQPDAIFCSPNFSFLYQPPFIEWQLRNALGDFYSCGARGYYDVMFQQLYHYFDNDVDPAADNVNEFVLYCVDDVMNEYGDYNSPIWVTETGFWTSSTTEQVRYLFTQNAEIFSNSRVQRVTYNYMVGLPSQQTALDLQAGIFDGVTFDYRDEILEPISGDTTFVMAFAYPDLRRVYQLRTLSPPPHTHSFRLYVQTSNVIKIDMWGDTTQLVVSGAPGNYYVDFTALNANPIFVIEQPASLNIVSLQDTEGFRLSIGPNPFNNAVIISFNLQNTAYVEVEVYNLKGERIDLLQRGEMASGEHKITWEGRSSAGMAITSGIYFLKIQNGEERQKAQMVKLLYLK